jgi:predicted ATPase with chaperone activity
VNSVEAQAIRAEAPKRKQLEKAFADISVEADMFDQLGPAVNAGSGLFLYGAPGNGKTTIAKRITACFGSEIWIPHTIVEDGQFVKLFDAAIHEPVNNKSQSLLKTHDHDARWVKIRRPTVIVGGELTLDTLEIRHDPVNNVGEAALQMKSNCGCLLIDDFGRQRVSPTELLNRWIVPLESRVDFLTLATGKKIQIPFEQLIIFSTNLEPNQLADDAFLRRIPYKIEVRDPSPTEYHKLCRYTAKNLRCEYKPEVIDYLIDKHYKPKNRPLRRCQPRDLLTLVSNYCSYNDLPMELRPEYIDRVVPSYFTVLKGD